MNASILPGMVNLRGKRHSTVIKVIKVILEIDSKGYFCEQGLELTPPTLPDRVNL